MTTFSKSALRAHENPSAPRRMADGNIFCHVEATGAPEYYLLSLLPQWLSSWGGSGRGWDDVCAAGVTVFTSVLHAHDVGVQVHQPL